MPVSLRYRGVLLTTTSPLAAAMHAVNRFRVVSRRHDIAGGPCGQRSYPIAPRVRWCHVLLSRWAQKAIRRGHGNRFHHRGRRIGRLRAGRQADGRRPLPGAGAGGRRQRPALLGAGTARLWQAVLRQGGELGLYHRAPMPASTGAHDYWPRGKIVGGSSSINAMVYIRGHAADYEDWAAAGNPGWGWDEVLRVYKSMEDNEDGGDEFRGSGGPLHVSDVSDRIHPLCRAYLAAAEEAGLSFNPDFNGAVQAGAGIYEVTTFKGRRNSAARAFLYPAMKRGQVETITNAHVTRVLFDGKRASGVEYMMGGETRTATARREVILAGGAVNTPQILQLSGIGPGALLQSLGIAVVHPTPMSGGTCRTTSASTTPTVRASPASTTCCRPWWGKLAVGLQYLVTGGGPLSLSLNQGGGFFSNRCPAGRGPTCSSTCRRSPPRYPERRERPLLTPDPFPGFSLGLSSCRPKARGFIEIASHDPLGGATHRAQCLWPRRRHRRNAGGGEIPAPSGVACRHWPTIIEEELLPGPEVASDAALVHDIRAALRHGLSSLVHLPHGAARRLRGGRSAPQGARHRGLAHRRCLDLSQHHFRQHQRPRHDGRHPGGRDHLRGSQPMKIARLETFTNRYVGFVQRHGRHRRPAAGARSRPTMPTSPRRCSTARWRPMPGRRRARLRRPARPHHRARAQVPRLLSAPRHGRPRYRAVGPARASVERKPVVELIGGKPGKLRAYASSMKRDITPEDEAERLPQAARRVRLRRLQVPRRRRVRARRGRMAGPDRGDRADCGAGRWATASPSWSMPIPASRHSGAIEVGHMLEAEGVSPLRGTLPLLGTGADQAGGRCPVDRRHRRRAGLRAQPSGGT